MANIQTLKLPVANGTLVAFVDHETKQAGIQFETPNGDIVDLAYAGMVNRKNEDYCSVPHENDDTAAYTHIKLLTYHDPYNEDYTHHTTIDTEDILIACNDPSAPAQ